MAKKNENHVKLLRAYRMYQIMMHYPHLVLAMRNIFRSVLLEKTGLNDLKLQMDAENAASGSGNSREKPVDEYMSAAVDLAMVEHFSDEEIDQYINLARKEDRLRNLIKVVNTEGVTSLRIKRALREFCEIPEGNTYVSPSEAEGVRVALINHFVSNQLPFLGIAKQHITIRDVDEMVQHSYWSPRYPGRIGGKAAGLLLAYRIVLPRLTDKDPELARYLAIPESYYFNSGIFSDFVDYNQLYELHTHKYKSFDEVAASYETFPELLEKTQFPEDTQEMFRDFLKETGEAPLILRSSSLLEDNFGHAFSGKYDSVFISNCGSLEERLNEFTRGLKQVLMSTFAPAPILYRRERNLLDFDERMSVLAQKVVGRRFGDFFFPFAGGVAFSFNAYGWTARIRKEEGLIRLVFGMGTRAVDRVGDDYPRMIPVSHPLLRPEVDAAQIRKYSQKTVDVFNMKKRRLESISFLDLIHQVDHPDLFYAVSINQEGSLSAPMFKGKQFDGRQTCLTFENFLSHTPFIRVMAKILQKLEEAYGRPVDVEFAWDKDKLYLLQCRTLSLRTQLEPVSLPEDIPSEMIFFRNNKGITNGLIKDIEYIVYVDPKRYNQLTSYEKKVMVGRAVGKINRLLRDKRFALFGPGRWGSNDINLGVRVGYEDINNTRVLGEIAFQSKGSTPEVSYGTHFFNDLVEANIIPLAIYPDQPGEYLNEPFLMKSENQLSKIAPDLKQHEPVIRVIQVPTATNGCLLTIYQDGQNQTGMGIFFKPS